MPIQKLQLRPGINRETTDYGNTGGYYDCNMVRFRNGQPESIGGWTRFTSVAAQGVWRSLNAFSLLNGDRLYSGGTTYKYYLIRGNGLIDITPLRKTVDPMSNNPFTTTAAGSTTVDVHDVGHGAVLNDFVTFSGATGPVDGIPASDLNQEHQITAIIDSDNYSITVATPATVGSVSGGGAAVIAEYQINVGLNQQTLGNGWGTGTWGGTDGVGWGEGSDNSVVTQQLRLWYEDNFGEDLLFNVRDGGIYYKDMGAAVTNRAVELQSLVGAVTVPVVARQVLVSDNDRHVIAFGCNPIDSVVQDRQLIRWSDSENAANWDETNTAGDAGELRINKGSEILRAIETQTEVLVFTDVSLHSFKFVGAPYIFGQTMIGSNVSLIAPNAVTTTGSITVWMETGVRFKKYDGAVSDIPCDVRTYISEILNYNQQQKIVAGVNRQYGEFWWHMPVNGSQQNNFYLVYNYVEDTWYYGDFNGVGRTTWLDAFYENTPLAGAVDGYIYLHESGTVDGSQIPNVELMSYLVGSVFEITDGGQFMLISRYIPDFDFSRSSAANPSVLVKFTPRDYPGSPFGTGVPETVTRTVATPIEQFTPKKDFRLRTRSVQYSVESNGIGTAWQQGLPRLYLAPDGQR